MTTTWVALLIAALVLAVAGLVAAFQGRATLMGSLNAAAVGATVGAIVVLVLGEW